MGELRVAAVQRSNNSPLPQGGWTLGDIFFGNAKAIVKVTNNTNTVILNWAGTFPQGYLLFVLTRLRYRTDGI